MARALTRCLIGIEAGDLQSNANPATESRIPVRQRFAESDPSRQLARCVGEMPDRTLIAEWNARGGAEVAALTNTWILKRRCSGRIPAETDVTLTHEVSSAGGIANTAGLPVILAERRKNEIRLKLVTIAAITRRSRIAPVVQIVWLKQDYGCTGSGMAMHAEHAVAEGLHPRAHVVFHEHPAVTAALIPVGAKAIAIS